MESLFLTFLFLRDSTKWIARSCLLCSVSQTRVSRNLLYVHGSILQRDVVQYRDSFLDLLVFNLRLSPVEKDIIITTYVCTSDTPLVLLFFIFIFLLLYVRVCTHTYK